MRSRAISLALVALVACKKKAPDVADGQLAALNDFANDMCSCKAHDKTCADEVGAAMKAWSKRGGRAKDAPRDEATRRKLTEIGRRYDECWTLAMTAAPGEIKPAEPTPPPPPPPPPPPKKATLSRLVSSNVDELFRQARDYGAQERPDLHLARVSYWYVDAEALLDPTHGSMELSYGTLEPIQKRRLGTPVVAHTGSCVRYWAVSGSWMSPAQECPRTIEYSPRCTVAAIWKRAIAKKVPADAVASIELDVPKKKWSFTIDDDPTNVHIKHAFADDCELNVEATGSGHPPSER